MSATDAERISCRIQDKHLLYGFIGETQFEAVGSNTVTGTVGNGDGALWTGMYLAAEAFHYAVTGTSQARGFMADALQRVRDLATIVPDQFLVRTLFPTDSDFFDQFFGDESHSGLYDVLYRNHTCVYPGHPTRDQYAGVLFGLGITHDIVGPGDATVKATCCQTITHLVDRLIASDWTMSTPTPPFSENYNIRPDQYLSVLQLARHVNPGKFSDVYEDARPWRSVLAKFPLIGDILIAKSKYYLLHLDYLYYYWLVQYETDTTYLNRYRSLFTRLRHATKDHGNPHFNMLDFVLNGPDATRDAETVSLLDDLLERGFTDTFRATNKNASDPLPVGERPYADFLWQRNPFALKEPGPGTQESPGIDYILPYWMARYYNVVSS